MFPTQDNNTSDDVETKGRKKVYLDTILVNEIGQFGKFQLKTLILALIITIFVAWGVNEYLFTTARINTRCAIPECDVDPPEWSPHWLLNAVPFTNQDSFDNCMRFGNVNPDFRLVENTSCPSTFFDRNTLQPCEDYVYENTHSIVYDFGLACDEWRRSFVGTMRMVGTLTALPITGYVSDRWGRRVALTLTCFNMGWLGLLRYWSNTYIGFTVSEFFESTFGTGAYSSVYILISELVGPKYRGAAGASIFTGYACGQVILGLIAWSVPYWKNLTLVLYTPILLTISCFWLMPESVRWYMSKGRFEESETLLRKIAKQNGKVLLEESLQALRHTAEVDNYKKKLEEKYNENEPWLIVLVFRHKQILLRCIISPFWWITTTFIYYGLGINAVNMSGNIYLNYIAVSAVEIPGYWLAFYFMERIGRKPVLIVSFWCCAVCQIAYVFLPQDVYAASLIVYLIAKCAIAMAVTTVYAYTSELYPTRHRHALFAYSSMMGRIGSILAPLTPALAAEWFADLPFVLFASFGLISGGLIFLTPETLGTNLPDTFEQASTIGLKQENRVNSSS